MMPSTSLLRLYALAGVLVCLFTVLGFSTLPGKLEQEEMLQSANRLPQALAVRAGQSVDSMTEHEAATRASIFYSAGDLTSAIQLFETLDTNARLDFEGLEILAHYYGENQQFQKRYLTLLRLAKTHLNESDARNVAANFEALGMDDEHLQMLEIMRERNFTDTAEDIKLANIYRFKGRRAEALGIFETLLLDDVSEISVNEMRILSRLLKSEGRASELPALHDNWMIGEFEHRELALRLSYLLEQKEYAKVASVADEQRSDDERFEVFYETALYHQLDHSAEARRAYTKVLLSKFNAAETDAEQQKLAYEIFASTTSDNAYELLSHGTVHDIEFVETLYRDRLIKEGRTERVAQLLFSEYQSPHLDAHKKLEIINQVAAINRYDLAEIGYRELAIELGPDSDALTGLLFSWKKLKRAPDVDWIGRQLLASDAEAFDSWSDVLLKSASPSKLLNWLDRTSVPERHASKIIAMKIEVSMWVSDNARINSYISNAAQSNAVSVEDSIQHLELACSMQNDMAALSIVRRLESNRALQSHGHLCAARIFSNLSNAPDTIRHYASARQANASLSFDDLVRYAEASEKASNIDTAVALKKEAINMLPTVSSGSPESNMTRGYLLMDVGRTQDAAASFEAVYASRVSDIEKLKIKKILMQIYLDNEDYDGVLRLQ